MNIDYQIIKQFAINKKEKWANEDDYYTPKRKWGEHKKYGYELKSPYSKKELDECLDKKEIILPDSLYKYLTEVSKELVFSSYPTVFNIENLPSHIQTEKLTLTNTKYLTEYDFYYKDDDDDEDNKENHKNLYDIEDFKNVMVNIGDDGCSFSDCIYLGSGDQYGTIWYYNSNSDGDGYGDAYTKVFNNFEEMLIFRTKDKPKKKPINPINYNMLRILAGLPGIVYSNI